MSSMDELISAIRSELHSRLVPQSVEILGERLGHVTVGIGQRVPIAFRGTRMFRVVRWDQKPSHVDQVGAPRTGSSRINRLSDQGQRVLYLADSPDTAFAESRTVEGTFCMSEWRVQVDKLALANGGIAAEEMAGLKDIYEGEGSSPVPTFEDEKVLSLLREIYTLYKCRRPTAALSVVHRLRLGQRILSHRRALACRGGQRNYKVGRPAILSQRLRIRVRELTGCR